MYTVHWVVCTVYLVVYTAHWVVYTVYWVVCTAPNYSLPKPVPMPIAYATGGVYCTLHRITFYLSVPNSTLLANSMPYSLSPLCTMSKCTLHTDD